MKRPKHEFEYSGHNTGKIKGNSYTCVICKLQVSDKKCKEFAGKMCVPFHKFKFFRMAGEWDEHARFRCVYCKKETSELGVKFYEKKKCILKVKKVKKKVKKVKEPNPRDYDRLI